METNLQATLLKTDNLNNEKINKSREEQSNNHEENKDVKQESDKTDQCEAEITELLGSVTTHNCPGTRFSARVIQKMKLDQTRPSTPPNDREQKKDEKSLQKTPSNIRANKPVWTNLERNHFFDALNEFGKDFEAIGNYINMKLKRKNAIDKTTLQVRQHYYQTYHKICKYIKYSDEIKKPAQELYALINYGEMRRKLQFVTDKHFMKLKNLVYQGHITVRCKGKNIRVKTPSCKALRRINQLDDALDDIRLPSKIEVMLTPANMETFGRLQTIAQNPRVRCMVPLHKKLMNFMKTFQYKWRSSESRLAEEEAKLFATDNEKNSDNTHAVTHDPEMCFLPKSGVTIHRPLLSITEHLSSVDICLSAYEERLGVKVRSESLCLDRVGNTKRQRTDSGSEKRSPEAKKLKSQLHDKTHDTETHDTNKEPSIIQAKSESSSDEMMPDDINLELLSDTDNMATKENLVLHSSNGVNNEQIAMPVVQQMRTKRALPKSIKSNSATTFKPLLNAETIRRIRKGWTVSNAADITIGDLYLVFGQDSRLELEYYWTDQQTHDKLSTATSVTNSLAGPSSSTMATAQKSNAIETSASFFTQKQSGMPYNPAECDDPNVMKTISNSNIGNKLKHLLLIANLSERIRKRQCSCGHICERGTAKTRFGREAAKAFYSGNPVPSTQTLADFNKCNASPLIRTPDGSVFRQPILPPRRLAHNMDPVKQLAALSGQKMSRQVFVQRLMLPGGANQTQEIDNEKTTHSNNNNTVALKQIATNSTTTQNMTTNSENFSLPSTVPTSKVDQPTQNVCSFAGAVEALTSLKSSTSSTQESSFPTPPQTSSTLTDIDCNSLTSLFSGMSPMHLLRDTTSNSNWLEENINDFSLTSLLGHLDEINTDRDIVDHSNLSVISESSVDYMHKFQEISDLMKKQDKD